MRISKKKYDIQYTGGSVESTHYQVGDFGIGRQQIGLPGAKFNRSGGYSDKMFLEVEDLNNAGRIGNAIGVLGVITELMDSFYEIYKDYNYGDTFRGVLEIFQDALLGAGDGGEIKEFDFDMTIENGDWDMNVNEGDYMRDKYDKPDYKGKIAVPGNKGLTPEQFQEMKAKIEKFIKERNTRCDIKEFKDRASKPPSSSNSFDYNDTPFSGGGGNGSGGQMYNPKMPRKTAIV